MYLATRTADSHTRGFVPARASTDPGTALAAIALYDDHDDPAALDGLPGVVRVLDPPLAELVAGMLDTLIADTVRAGGRITIDLDDLVDRAEHTARGHDRRADPDP